MRGWGTVPNSSVNVTCISRQCFILGQLDNSLLAREQDAEWENYPMLLTPIGPLHVGMACTCGPPFRLAPGVPSTRSLDLAAMDMKAVAVN